MPVPPKRDEHRRRTNTPDADHAPRVVDTKLGPEIPEELGIEEGSIGALWYESLRTSGQAIYYTESDWSTAWFLALAMNDFRETGNGQILTAVLRGMGQLMTTEGERRKVRLELDAVRTGNDDVADPTVAILADYRAQLGSG